MVVTYSGRSREIQLVSSLDSLPTTMTPSLIWSPEASSIMIWSALPIWSPRDGARRCALRRLRDKACVGSGYETCVWVFCDRMTGRAVELASCLFGSLCATLLRFPACNGREKLRISCHFDWITDECRSTSSMQNVSSTAAVQMRSKALMVDFRPSHHSIRRLKDCRSLCRISGEKRFF